MAETGEVAPKSGRDAETGFWMVPHGEKVKIQVASKQIFFFFCIHVYHEN